MFEMNFSKFTTSFSDTTSIQSYRDIGIPAGFHSDLPFILRAMLYRSHINMNTFILAVGNPRTSKSYCAMKIAEMYSEKLGQKFDVEKQLTFSDVKKFMIWSQNAENSIFILDETGTSLAPDMFWSLQQRIMRRFVQTQGFRKNVLIWVLPSIVFIQKGFRFMSNYAIRTLRQGQAEIYKVVVNQLIGKGYPDRIETLNYTYPSKEMCEIYEKLKKEWNDIELENDIQFLHKIDNPDTRRLNKSDVLDLLKNKVIDKDFAREELLSNGYDEIRTGLLLDNVNKKIELKEIVEEGRWTSTINKTTGDRIDVRSNINNNID